MELVSVNGCKKQAELTEQLLRYLIEKGYEGEGLIGKFKEIKPMFFSHPYCHKAF